jgi:hypothetical protein
MTPDKIAIGVAAAALGAHALLTTVAVGDMARPPHSSAVDDPTARFWLEYAESFTNSDIAHHVARSFFTGVALGIRNVKQLFSASEITQLQAEITKLEGVVAVKQRKLNELQAVLATYNQLIAKYGDAVTHRGNVVQEASAAIGDVAKADQELLTKLQACDALIQAMVADFESVDNKVLLGQYAQLAASCQQEKDKIESLTQEFDALQRKYPQVMEQFKESSARFGHTKSASQGDLNALASAVNVLSPSKQVRGSYVGTPTRLPTAEVIS